MKRGMPQRESLILNASSHVVKTAHSRSEADVRRRRFPTRYYDEPYHDEAPPRWATGEPKYDAPAEAEAGAGYEDGSFSFLPEPTSVEANPVQAKDQVPKRAMENVADFPEPLSPTKSPEDWAEAKRYLDDAMKYINTVRYSQALDWVDQDPKKLFLAKAWQQVASTDPKFMLCAHMEVSGEEEYVLMEVISENGKPIVSHVTPAQLVLGRSFVHMAEDTLTDGESVDIDTATREAFDCSPPKPGTPENPENGVGRVGSSYEMTRTKELKKLFAPPAHSFASHPSLGLIHLGDAGLRGMRSNFTASQFPEAYNSRDAFPQCALAVKNQGGCGSCYAFAAAAMAGERLCIYRNKHEQMSLLASEASMDKFLTDDARAHAQNKSWLRTLLHRGRARANLSLAGMTHKKILKKSGIMYGEDLSQQGLVSCGSSDRPAYQTPYCLLGPGSVPITKFTSGCEGATTVNTLFYIHIYGMPTRECIPYVSGGMGTWKEHFDLQAGHVPTCALLEDEACHKERAQNRMGPPQRCEDGDTGCMMAGIHNKGPIFVSIYVTKKFFGYQPGAYEDDVFHIEQGDDFVGGHAVTLHGWGVSPSGIQYWWGRNSWGTKWGLDGMFKLRRGTDEMGVETEAYFSEADPDDKHFRDGPCVKVWTQEGGSDCVIRNDCSGEIRKATVAFFGDTNTGNCGSWTRTFGLVVPGFEGARVVQNAHYCRIIEDEKVSDHDPTRYYEDHTASFASQGYTCVLKNTFSGAGQRMVCCGGRCANSKPGSLVAFPTEFCDNGCDQGVYEQTE